MCVLCVVELIVYFVGATCGERTHLAQRQSTGKEVHVQSHTKW